MAGRRLAGVAIALTVCLGCTPQPPGGELVGSIGDSIVNGSLDTVHQSAVAYLQGGKCSASIIEVNVATGEGYALTAGHCISGQAGVIRQGNDHSGGNFDEEYPVVERDTHPGYPDSSLYDFAMLRFTGATGATPFNPPLDKNSDSLAVNQPVDLVGYGQTESGGTSLRHHISKPIYQLSQMRLLFDQATSGICSGDSGGPGYRTIASVEYVVGVNVSVTQTGCTGPNSYGSVLRVSRVEDTFIRPFIDNTAYQLQTCDECTEANTADGDCNQQTADCFDSVACTGYIDCVDLCTTNVCVNQCRQTHASGWQMYQQIISCVCNVGCATECTGDALCKPPPQCGIDWFDDECETCGNQFCCDQQNDCSVDTTCMQCIGSTIPPIGCADDPMTTALLDCLELSCPTECDAVIPDGVGGGGGAPVGVGGGSSDAAVGVGVGSGGSSQAPDDDLEVVEQGCACQTPGSARGAAWWLALIAALAVRHQGRRRRPG